LALFPLGGMQKQSFIWSRPSSERGAFWGWIGHFGHRRLCISLERNIKVLEFAHPPELRLLWADSGQSVALFLNEEPWAFIHEEKNHGYSKGILTSAVGNLGNPWNQELFERTFTDR
jgi:hypothetical protein